MSSLSTGSCASAPSVVEIVVRRTVVFSHSVAFEPCEAKLLENCARRPSFGQVVCRVRTSSTQESFRSVGEESHMDAGCAGEELMQNLVAPHPQAPYWAA
eukprot:5261460-Amphidinium_carterae.2